MKHAKTKSALLMSAISILLSISMLIGTTFAWFTDTASSGVNTIKSGNLDVVVEYSKDGTNWTDLEGSESLFSGNLWEPGHTEYVYLRVKNAGTLALKYQVNVSPVSETGGINMPVAASSCPIIWCSAPLTRARQRRHTIMMILVEQRPAPMPEQLSSSIRLA